jgi:flavin-dependent dehydrogenase
LNVELDVAVVGGSSAGFYVAELLAAAGKRVGVFDRQRGLCHSRRTLIVTSELERVTGPIPGSIRLTETGVIRLVCGDEAVAISLRRPDPIVERSEFVRWMQTRAVAAGAEVFWGADLSAVGLKGQSACLEFSGPGGRRQVSVRDAVIGADGSASTVATKTGIAKPVRVPILQAEVRIPDYWDPDLTQVWFDRAHTRFFYWLIPEATGRAVVGVIGEQATELRTRLGRFLVKQNLVPLAYQGARVALHHPRLRPWQRVGNTTVCLVGDAAGHVKVTTVGGTVTGLLGAEAAARSILNGHSYRRHLSFLRRELDLHWMIRKFLDRLDNQGYALLLSSLSHPVRTFLGQHNRDSMASVFWKIPLLQPKLFLVALRAFSGKQVETSAADTLLAASENE